MSDNVRDGRCDSISCLEDHMLPLERLRECVRIIPSGTISIEQSSQVVLLLAGCWDGLSGSHDGGMTGDKINVDR